MQYEAAVRDKGRIRNETFEAMSTFIQDPYYCSYRVIIYGVLLISWPQIATTFPPSTNRNRLEPPPSVSNHHHHHHHHPILTFDAAAPN
ncbi:hypothetical protein DL98DRAFT_121115 [Cadophora sp. DSE1049]|nr:hypothetical protein DL98DRAFT_121115 [Cadophora sp. DSE1049]